MAEGSALHHIEYCVKDEKPLMNKLITGFGFRVSYVRHSSTAIQWVLVSESCIFIVTKHLPNVKNSHADLSNYHYPAIGSPHGLNANTSNTAMPPNERLGISEDPSMYPFLFCHSFQQDHTRDCAFNIALDVRDVDSIVTRLELSGEQILVQPFNISNKHGEIRVAVIASQCRNIIHTLLDKSKYKGPFLPGFYSVDKFKNDHTEDATFHIYEDYLIPTKIPEQNIFCNYIDHVTFVCEAYESKNIINWYKKIFKMERLFTNKDESIEEGFVLKDGIGLRLKAMQYWQCAETGVTCPPHAKNPNILRIVIAEPLLEIESSHVTSFIRENEGPGVQHIGLHCEDIVDVVTKLKARGVKFRTPPPTYYAELGDGLYSIVDTFLSGDHEKFRTSGVLLDVEEDLLCAEQDPKFLMQIFTEPIFSEDTLFLEVIQRNNATGFGAGNITALSRSIARYEEEKKREKESLLGGVQPH